MKLPDSTSSAAAATTFKCSSLINALISAAITLALAMTCLLFVLLLLKLKNKVQTLPAQEPSPRC